MPKTEDEGFTYQTTDDLEEPRPKTLDDFRSWDEVFANRSDDTWVKLVRTVSEVEVEATRARLDERLVKDFLDDAVPPRDRFADLATLEPSDKSKMPVEFQARILEAMRQQNFDCDCGRNPVRGWAFFGPAGWSKSTLCTAWFAQYARANVMDISRLRWSDMHEHIEFPKNRTASFLWRMNALTLIDENLAWQHRDFANKAAKQPRVSSAWIEALQSHHFYSCLYLEEVDKIRTDKPKLDILFDVINALYDYHGVLLLNSNLTKQEFATQFGPEFARRISEMCNVVDCFAQGIKTLPVIQAQGGLLA